MMQTFSPRSHAHLAQLHNFMEDSKGKMKEGEQNTFSARVLISKTPNKSLMYNLVKSEKKTPVF